MADVPPRVSERPFGIGNRLKRWIWTLCWTFVDGLTPSFVHRPRIFVLKLFGAKIGRGCRVYRGSTVWAPWNLSMEDYVAIGAKCDVYSMALIILKKGVTISQKTTLCTGTHDYRMDSMPLVTSPIIVLADAWICAEVFIGPGVTIGEGAVIGARSLVVKDVPAWAVMAGSPAKYIKDRPHV
jgi:putative colanic acid biosynthesis acetyltransferase WcaF